MVVEVAVDVVVMGLAALGCAVGGLRWAGDAGPQCIDAAEGRGRVAWDGAEGSVWRGAGVRSVAIFVVVQGVAGGTVVLVVVLLRHCVMCGVLVRWCVGGGSCLSCR